MREERGLRVLSRSRWLRLSWRGERERERERCSTFIPLAQPSALSTMLGELMYLYLLVSCPYSCFCASLHLSCYCRNLFLCPSNGHAHVSDLFACPWSGIVVLRLARDGDVVLGLVSESGGVVGDRASDGSVWMVVRSWWRG